MASSQGFWTSAQQTDPKRNFRFLVTLGSMPDGATWYAKTAKKPSFEIKSATHEFLNHTFHYPGRLTWNEVEVVLVDPVSPDAAANLSRIIYEAGYHPPANVNDVTTMSKQKAVASLQTVVIAQIDSEGVPVETWTLNNAFIVAVTYGELDYSKDELSTVTIKFRYDWASLETAYQSETGPLGTAPRSRFWMPGQNS